MDISPSIPKAWQEIVELVVRGASAVLCFIIMICAAVTLSAIEDTNDAFKEADMVITFRDFKYDDSSDYEAAAGWVVFVAVMGMAIESLIIGVRILNVSFVNQNFTIFGIVDMVISGIFFISLLSGAAANAAYSSDNDEFYDSINEPFCNNQVYTQRTSAIGDACDGVQRVRDAEGATAAFSFFGMVAFGGLGAIMLFNILRKGHQSPGKESSSPE